MEIKSLDCRIFPIQVQLWAVSGQELPLLWSFVHFAFGSTRHTAIQYCCRNLTLITYDNSAAFSLPSFSLSYSTDSSVSEVLQLAGSNAYEGKSRAWEYQISPRWIASCLAYWRRLETVRLVRCLSWARIEGLSEIVADSCSSSSYGKANSMPMRFNLQQEKHLQAGACGLKT